MGLLEASTSRVITIDNHDSSYYLWKEAGITDAVVVHIDAHHDLFDIKGMAVPCIGDYLRWAIRDGIVREIYWVVPEPAWRSGEGQAAIKAHLKAIARTADKCWTFNPRKHLGTTKLQGCKITACSISSLPAINGTLLLDIDVDYMLVQEPPFGDWNSVPERPWVWPVELANQISDPADNARMITICYSVKGGYTPLVWKHLGDDLALALTSEHREEVHARLELKRSLLERLIVKEASHTHVADFRAEYSISDPSLYAWEALSLLRAGDGDKARDSYTLALEMDLAYSDTFGWGGPLYETLGEYEAAESAYRTAVELNERDAFGWYGLGRMALRNGDTLQASECFEKSTSFPGAPAEVYRDYGLLLEAEGDSEGALKNTRLYLRNAFRGFSLDLPVSSIHDHSYRSPCWSAGYNTLARLYSTAGKSKAANNCYMQALKMVNRELYDAIRPLAGRSSSAKRASAGLTAACCAKAAMVGVRSVGRRIGFSIGKIPGILGFSPRYAGSGQRLCPPVTIYLQRHRKS